MSCFQGRPQNNALSNLLALNPDGIQLTPGNHPTSGFKESLNLPYRFHHGFSWNKYRRDIYDGAGKLIIDISYQHSIHPPKNDVGVSFNQWISTTEDYLLEIMYPGYFLGNGQEIEQAMDLNKRLALDISHLYIQQCQEVISKKLIDKLLCYHNIQEIHVSHNNGINDTHQPINTNTPFISIIQKKSIPIVYESYLHKSDLLTRHQQIDLLRNLL